MPVTMAEGLESLRQLAKRLAADPQEDRNEAQTRLDAINHLIVDCFGWGRDATTRLRVEVFERGEYSDYELGIPRCAIWEAKREGISFELPPGSARNPIQDIQSVLRRTNATKEALEQVQRYCVARGVELAVAANGHQLIAFLATRSDGLSPLDGHCFVVDSLSQLQEFFPTAWDLLSVDGVAERRYLRLLKLGTVRNIPPKLSSYLKQYPRQRYLSDLQSNLRTLSELLLQDIGDSEEEEEQFIRRCYCPSGALSQHALLNKRILEARYSALIESTGGGATVEAANPKDGPHSITPGVLQEALSRRPIILIGDVGVGKSSFLKHLIIEDAKELFQNAIYIFVDLGQKGTLDPDVRELILRETERQLLKKYQIDIRESQFLRGVYASEIERFRRGPYSEVLKTNPTLAEEKLADLLASHLQAAFEHIRRSILHLSRGWRRQVIYILDNADQRKDEVQQQAFLIAQELARDWTCHVFVSLRPGTFYRSRVSGVLAAYPHRVFSISPPRADAFLEKRLTYALDMAEGRLPLERTKGIRLNIGSVAEVIRALLNSLDRNDDLQELLANVTGGNVRELLQFVTSFVGSPNVDAEKIVSIMATRGSYRIPLHEFSKAALLGDYAHYHAESSLATNVFDVRGADPREHFLAPLLLSCLEFEAARGQSDGFMDRVALVQEAQANGFTADQAQQVLDRLNERRLVETPIRDTMSVESGSESEGVHKIRLTARGAYHLLKWMPTFSYLDAMVFDTPIFDDELRETQLYDLESFDIGVRYKRALDFKSYLLRQWRAAEIRASHFDFEELMRRGEGTFSSVHSAIPIARSIERLG